MPSSAPSWYRRQPFFRATNYELRSKRNTFVLLQMAIVADQHDRVAGGNSKHRHKTYQRAQRDDAAGRSVPATPPSKATGSETIIKSARRHD